MICKNQGCFNLNLDGFRSCKACLLGFTPDVRIAEEEE